jgi:hypothetical protein
MNGGVKNLRNPYEYLLPSRTILFSKITKINNKNENKNPQVPHKFEIKINLNKNPWYHNSYGKLKSFFWLLKKENNNNNNIIIIITMHHNFENISEALIH